MNNIQLFLNTLPIMLQGMLGIFIVLIVIYLLIAVLNRATARPSRKQASDRPEANDAK